MVGIIDPPRPEARVAIGEAQSAGVRILMITGDHPRTALRIASELGIGADGARALTGAEIDGLDDEALIQAVRTSRCSPGSPPSTSSASSTPCRTTGTSWP